MEFPVQFMNTALYHRRKKSDTAWCHFFSFCLVIILLLKQPQFFQFKMLNIMHALLIL